jgi:hypothetical protein
MSVKIVRREIMKTNTDNDDGVFERKPQNDHDQFGHKSRGEYIKKRPITPKPEVEIVGNFAKDAKPLPSPISEPRDFSRAYELCDQLADGRQDHEF